MPSFAIMIIPDNLKGIDMMARHPSPCHEAGREGGRGAEGAWRMAPRPPIALVTIRLESHFQASFVLTQEKDASCKM